MQDLSSYVLVEPRKLYEVPREMGTMGELKDEIGLKSRVIRDAIVPAKSEV